MSLSGHIMNGRRAFTLVEVMLALGLFVVATGILAGTLYSGLHAYRAAANDTLTENRYRLVLRQVLQIEDRAEFERGGTMRLPDDTRAEWEVQLDDADSLLLDLFEVALTVRLSGNLPARDSAWQAQPQRTFNLSLYRPGWSDPVARSRLLEERQRALEDRRGTR